MHWARESSGLAPRRRARRCRPERLGAWSCSTHRVARRRRLPGKGHADGAGLGGRCELARLPCRIEAVRDLRSRPCHACSVRLFHASDLRGESAFIALWVESVTQRPRARPCCLNRSCRRLRQPVCLAAAETYRSLSLLVLKDRERVLAGVDEPSCECVADVRDPVLRFYSWQVNVDDFHAA